jgi:hypothetical protein
LRLEEEGNDKENMNWRTIDWMRDGDGIWRNN